MVDGVVEAAAKLLQQLRLADVLDVLVMSVLIYAAISWLRGAQSRFVVRGIGGLVALYFVARLLGMQLTLFVFQAVLTVAVVALVIIFQEDIRRGFERIAVRARLGARKAGAPEETTVRTVVRAVARLAAERTGALIVFKGREPLERHLSGGVLLHGRLSDQLLYSIFDTSSPGHDGAVVIDAGLVERFGVHLPLSTDPDGQGRGTRHAAALGLAERSDAFVIVVSEERGRISVAHAGSLRELSPTQVQEQLRDFVRQTTAGGLRARSGSLRRFGLKVLSVALAVVAWVVITRVQAETLERTLTVPVTYRNVPDAWMLEEPDPPSVRVTLTGTA
jgi:diadenylate cyclase